MFDSSETAMIATEGIVANTPNAGRPARRSALTRLPGKPDEWVVGAIMKLLHYRAWLK
jgi:hypothetical protein